MAGGETLLQAMRGVLDKLLAERGLGEQLLHARNAKVLSCDREAGCVDLEVLSESGAKDERWPMLPEIELPPFVQSLGAGSIVRFGYAYGTRSGIYIAAIEAAVDCVLQFDCELRLGSNEAALGVPLGAEFVDALAAQLSAAICGGSGSPLSLPSTFASALKAKCSEKVKVS